MFLRLLDLFLSECYFMATFGISVLVSLYPKLLVIRHLLFVLKLCQQSTS